VGDSFEFVFLLNGVELSKKLLSDFEYSAGKLCGGKLAVGWVDVPLILSGCDLAEQQMRTFQDEPPPNNVESSLPENQSGDFTRGSDTFEVRAIPWELHVNNT